MLKTVVDNLSHDATDLRDLLAELLLQHSALYEWNRNEPGDTVVFISTSGNYAYRKLNEEGLVLQAKTLEEYRRFNAIVRCLLREQTKETLLALRDSQQIVERTIEQETTWCKTTEEALAKVEEALVVHTDLLKRLYDPSKGQPSYVPDTNALLHNPRLELWKFPDTPETFSLILLPTVLSELDWQKTNHRNESVRKKADTLISQIKEYRRRGKLTEGIDIVTGKIKLVAIAIEAGTDSFLPWFDSNNNDDRILAATLEVMRRRSNSPVLLVTRDINIQNKAEFARIPFVEPPAPNLGFSDAKNIQ